MEQIPVFRPLIEQEEFNATRQALELGWLGMGSYVGEFEEGLKDFTGASDRFVAAVSTGHAALHLGLLAAGVGPGDEVITPSFNNAADFQAILEPVPPRFFATLTQIRSALIWTKQSNWSVPGQGSSS